MNGLAAYSEIDKVREGLKYDAFPMSIGEMAHLYEIQDFTFTPNFGWSERQKEMFIKSILWGMPLPSIIVAHTKDGKWDLLDGAKRLNAIFDFMGAYKDEVPMPLHLDGGAVLYKDLPEIARINFVRARMDVKIIMATTPEAEFEVQNFLREMRG